MTDKAHALGTISVGTVLLTLAAVLGCPALAATFVGGMSTNLFSNLFDLGLRRGPQLLTRKSSDANGHLHAALRQAFFDAVETLEAGWPAYAEGEEIAGLTEESKALFDELRRDIDRLLTEDLIDDILGDADALRAFQTGESGAHAALDATIKGYLESGSPELVAYVQGHLIERVKACLIAQLKIDDEKHNPAWRAFQMLMLNSLHDELLALHADQHRNTTALMAELTSITTHLASIDASVRDPWGQPALDDVWKDLSKTITRESILTRQVAKRQGHLTRKVLAKVVRGEGRRNRQITQKTAQTQTRILTDVIQSANAHTLSAVLAELKTLHVSANSGPIQRALLSRLDDEDFDVRRAMVVFLTPFAIGDETVRHAVLTRLADKKEKVREAAFAALLPFIPTDPKIRQTLVDRFNHLGRLGLTEEENWFKREKVVQALAPLIFSDADVRQAAIAA